MLFTCCQLPISQYTYKATLWKQMLHRCRCCTGRYTSYCKTQVARSPYCCTHADAADIQVQDTMTLQETALLHRPTEVAGSAPALQNFTHMTTFTHAGHIAIGTFSWSKAPPGHKLEKQKEMKPLPSIAGLTCAIGLTLPISLDKPSCSKPQTEKLSVPEHPQTAAQRLC